MVPPSNQTISGRVRVAMNEAGESEKSLADATGIPRTTLRRRLTGNCSFTTAELAAIAAQVAVPLVDFLVDEQAAS